MFSNFTFFLLFFITLKNSYLIKFFSCLFLIIIIFILFVIVFIVIFIIIFLIYKNNRKEIKI